MGKDKEKLTGCEDQKLSGSKEGKGKRLWKKVKYQLVEYHSLPAYLKDNEYILGHYRAEWPLKQALLSIFTIHNETLNVWTHLIGFFLFLALTIYTAIQVPKVVDLHSLQNLPALLPHALHAECKGRCGKFNSTIAGETNNTLAILCLPWGCHVFLVSKQHMSFTFLPFKAFIIHHAEARLCRYRCPDINFILPSRLLFLHVLPLLLQPVPGIYYPPGNCHNLGFPPSCVPDPRISNHSSISILWNGLFRRCTYYAQAGFILVPTRGASHNWI